MAILAYPLLPIAVGIAILRYRLYDIDIVIQRTLVYVPLTALLAGIYAASIGISQRLFIAVTGNSSDGAIVLSTLILATTFTPIKNAIQGRVDRGSVKHRTPSAGCWPSPGPSATTGPSRIRRGRCERSWPSRLRPFGRWRRGLPRNRRGRNRGRGIAALVGRRGP